MKKFCFSVCILLLICLVVDVGFAEVRHYISQYRFDKLKPEILSTSYTHCDQIYDNFNHFNIPIKLYESSNVHDWRKRNLNITDPSRADYGYYDDSYDTGTVIKGANNEHSFKAVYQIEFSDYDQYLINNQDIYGYMNVRVKPNSEGADDTAVVDYRAIINGEEKSISKHSYEGLKNTAIWKFPTSNGQKIDKNTTSLKYVLSSINDCLDATKFFDMDVYFIDKTKPNILDISIANAPNNKFYKKGDKIQIVITTDERCTAKESKINLQGGFIAEFSRSENYHENGIYGSRLYYEYQIKEGDIWGKAGNSYYIKLNPSQGSLEEKIKDLAGNTCIEHAGNIVKLSSIEDSQLKIDGITPKINSIEIITNGQTIYKRTSSDTSASIEPSSTVYLKPGDISKIELTLSEPINLNHYVSAKLSNGKTITSESKLTNSTLSFVYSPNVFNPTSKYKIENNQKKQIKSSEDTDYLYIKSFSYNNGAITDNVGNKLVYGTEEIEKFFTSNLAVDVTMPCIIISDPEDNSSYGPKEFIVDAIDDGSGLKTDKISYAFSKFDIGSEYNKLNFDYQMGEGSSNEFNYECPAFVYYKIEDKAGNIGYDHSMLLKMDNIAPDLELKYTTPNVPQLVNNVEINASDVNGIAEISYQWVQVKIKDVDFDNLTKTLVIPNGSSNFAGVISDTNVSGLYNLAVRVKDQGGNYIDGSLTDIYFDNTPPDIELIYSNEVEKEYSIDVNVEDKNTNVAYEGTIQYIKYLWADNDVHIDRGDAGWKNINSSDTITAKYVGTKYLHIVSRDNAAFKNSANRNYSTFKFDFDTQGPQINLSNQILNGQYTESITVNVEDDFNNILSIKYAFSKDKSPTSIKDSDWTAFTVSESKTFTQAFTNTIDTGTFYLHIKATDKKGNVMYHLKEDVKLNNYSGNNILVHPEYSNNSTFDINLVVKSDTPELCKYAISEEEDDLDNFISVPTSHNVQYTFTGTGEKTIYVRFKNQDGQISDILSKSVIIDKLAPTADITYSTDQPTKEAVEVNIINVSDDLTENVTVIWDGVNHNNENPLTHVFENNGEATVTLSDNAGNTKEFNISIDYIDNIKPIVTFNPLTTDYIKSIDVVVTTDKIDKGATVSYRVLSGSTELVSPTVINSGETISLAYDNPVILEATSIDNLGNKTVYSHEYNTDNIAPVATVTQTPTNRTAGNVQVEIEFTELTQVQVIDHNGQESEFSNQKFIYQFSENGTYNYKLRDLAGNMVDLPIQINNIDKEASTAEITALTDTSIPATFTRLEVRVLPREGQNKIIASIKESTIDNMYLTPVESFYCDKDGNEVDSSGDISQAILYKAIYEVTNNGLFISNIEDIETKVKSSLTYNIDYLDISPPTVNFIKNTIGKSNEFINISLECIDDNGPVQIVSEPIASNEDGTYNFTNNGQYKFIAEDTLGNSATYYVDIVDIDRYLDYEIEYSTTNPTNQDVTVTVFSDIEEIQVLNNNGSPTYSFTENGDFTFNLRDEAGNTESVLVSVNWINKIATEFELTLSSKEPTNQPIELIIEPVELLQDANNVEGLQKKIGNNNIFIVNDRGLYTFNLTDIYGNITTEYINIKNVDTVPPELDYMVGINNAFGREYFSSSTILGDNHKCHSLVLDFFGEERYYFTEYDSNLIYDEGSNSFEVSENGTYSFIAKDIFGNTSTETITINCIDKVKPNLSVVYDTNIATSNNVNVTLVSDEEIFVINNNKQDKRVFSENGEFTFIVTDRAGNISEVKATVNNIDKTPPVIKTVYSTLAPTNNNVILTLESDEDFTVDNNGGKKSYTFTRNEAIIIKVRDNVGNTADIKCEVKNIDKKAPNLQFNIEGKYLLLSTEGSYDFLSSVYCNDYDFDRVEIDTSEVSFFVKGNYHIKFTAYDKLGNKSTYIKTVEIIDGSEPLIVRIDGKDPKIPFYLKTDELVIDLYNVFESSTIYYLPCRSNITEVKHKGIKATSNKILINESSWYSILIVDKDMNRRFYTVYINK